MVISVRFAVLHWWEQLYAYEVSVTGKLYAWVKLYTLILVTQLYKNLCIQMHFMLFEFNYVESRNTHNNLHKSG